MRKLFKLFLFVFVCLFCGLKGFAQEDSLKGKDLDEIVITGQYRAQSVHQSVYQVKVIKQETINAMGASNLQDILSNQLNFRYNQDLATGGSDLSMSGLSGQYVKVLIDGVPVSGRQGFNNEININQLDVSSIDRIEIVEGPMSVIYGADALAGVINIITQKKENHSALGVVAKVQEETAGNEYGWNKGIHNQHIQLSGSHKHWYFNGSIGRNMFNGWKDTLTGRELEWHKKRQFLGSGILGYRIKKLDVYYRYDGLDELITNPANLPGNGDPALDQEYISIRTMHQVQATIKATRKIEANIATSFTHYTRQVFSSLYYPNGDVRGVNTPGMNSLSTIDALTFRGSVTYRPYTHFTVQPGFDINTESGDGERIKAGKQQVKDYAFFVTAEYSPTPKLNIRPGLRLIKNSVYKAPPVVPSLHIKYMLTQRADIRIAYSRGFRSPSLRELYYDFFDANHSITGNPDLEAEHSNSITGSFNLKYGTNKLKARTILKAFVNDIDNMIDYAAVGSGNLTTYINIEKYKTRGIAIENNFQWKQFTMGLGLGYTGRYNSYRQDDKSLPEFKWSPELNTQASYHFKKAGLVANVFYKFTGKLPYYTEVLTNTGSEIRLAELKAYSWLDFTLNKKIGSMLMANAGIKNLFNLTNLNINILDEPHETGGKIPLAYGRSYFLSLVFTWNKK